MSPFDPGQPEVPLPPPDIPVPNVPNADFASIGQSFWSGVLKAKTAAGEVVDLLKWIAGIVGAILAALLKLLEGFIAGLLTIFLRIFNQAESGTDAISAAALTGILGSPVSAASFANPSDYGSRGGVRDSVVGAIIKAMGGKFTGGTAGEIVPGVAGAQGMMSLGTHMAVEGWLIEWLSETFSLGYVKDLGELKDALERCLGIGRMSARAMRPAIKIFASDPLTWQLNGTFRPAVPAIELLVREFLRGNIDQATLDKFAGYHGIPADQQAALINYTKHHLGASTIQELIDHGVLDQATGEGLLVAQGYDQTSAHQELTMLGARRPDAIFLEIQKVLLDAAAARKITAPTFVAGALSSGITAYEGQLLQQLYEAKLQANTTRPSASQGKKLFQDGIWTLQQYSDLLVYHGFQPQDVIDLELEAELELAKQSASQTARDAKAKAAAQALLAKQQAAAAKAAKATAEAEAHGVSVGVYKTLVKDGLKTLADYQAFLLLKGIAADNASAMVGELQAEIAKAAAGAAAKAGKTTGPKVKVLDLAQLEASVKAGHLTMAEFAARLPALGYDAADQTLIQELLQSELDAIAAKAAAKAATLAKAAVKHVNLAEEEKAARLGLIAVADYQTFLTGHGFAPEDITLLVGELNAQITADKSAAAKRAAVAAGVGKKGVSLQQLERSVRAGLSSITEYQAKLASLGYSAADQAELVSLLQLQMHADQLTLAARGRAAALLGQQGLSIANVERLVKYGVQPMASYTSALTAAGVSAADAQLLTLALTAQLAATKKAVAKLPTIGALLSAKGESLSSLESAVQHGALTMAEFQGQLSAAGVSAADIANVTTLLNLEIANRAAAAALTLDAAQRAARRGLSLGQEQTAVKAGAKTMLQYQAFLTQLGYAPADNDTLVATLQASSAYQKLIAGANPPPPPVITVPVP